MKTNKARADEVVRELAPLGKYRVRVIQGKDGPLLDIREYVAGETFEGFTRRGIRIGLSEADLLKDELPEILECMKKGTL